MRLLDLKETQKRGNYDFPVETYIISSGHPRYVMPMHWHEEYEMIQVQKGSFRYAIGQISGVAMPGDLLFVGSGELHSGVPEAGEYRCVVFDAMLLKADEGSAAGRMLAAFREGHLAVRCRLPAEDAALAAVVSQLFAALEDKPKGFELMAQGCIYQFFALVAQNGYYEQRDGSDGKKWVAQLKDAISLIEREYAAHLTLAELARAAGMSKQYFCHFFKRMTGCSPIEYLNRHRIEMACYRLMSGAQNVTELAYACGFNDLSYFIRAFKRIVGVTPKQYALEQRREVI